jgi:hypothetical protein
MERTDRFAADLSSHRALLNYERYIWSFVSLQTGLSPSRRHPAHESALILEQLSPVKANIL